ncbi:MAG: ABC transporter permease [Planctomycetota bacterium]
MIRRLRPAIPSKTPLFNSYQKLFSLVRMSVRSLMLHKLRSLLTILGLVFGVASVIIMLAVADGAGKEAQREIESLGITNVIVRSKKPSEARSDEDDEDVLSYGLNYMDMRRIRETLETIDTIAPVREYTYPARHLENMAEIRLVGIQPEYAKANDIEIAVGRFIEPFDVLNQTNRCVLGHEAAQKLFPGDSPLDKEVHVADRMMFIVVGVTKPKMSSAGAGSSLSAQDFNRDIYIPLSTDRNRMGEVLVTVQQGTESFERLLLSQLTVTVKDKSQVKSTAAAIESLLASTHEMEDFEITIPLDLLEKAQATQRIFNFLFGSIAAISLLVGGIGIMNIMLATVSERTGEIGIRRALGATRGDITLQFLVETSVLSLTGALVGAVVGLTAPPLITLIFNRETSMTLVAPMIAVLVAMAVGLIFGIYPARRAASLDPIEALRRV